ncbi:MAG: DUF262 domain-containing protein [Gammaproteobacteria bacterium]|uniref:DUF262 domain-containing protein n=1 Tax=Thiopseudomonas alkaliphila TaxID=1697053 RepID=A0AAW7DTB7_9GAMM|nr:DUF262 domain-containing HNH endonuclease family protein [Thiopseudomonas alkaliphila]MDM1695918.1 DUF262 domain-containing protein [Thiopseudomonas alkaliphila]NLY14763.1 DUF262 domain-containing protein [Gammaproteobacteria bacterium]
MSNKITGAEYPLAKIFSSDFDFVIPAYQRPYAWTDDQALDLFDDLYSFYLAEAEDESYFLGSIVLIKAEGRPASQVIDGQQRLTTLTILLSVITSFLEGEARSDLEKYIREPGSIFQGITAKPRLALRERDRQFFADYVQAFKFDELLALESAQLEESQQNIQRNARLLKDRLLSSFAGDMNGLLKFGAFLIQRCFLVVVSTDNEKSAFRVFSVLNSRGLDLLPTDIIKSTVIGNIITDKQEEFTNIWEELEVKTGRAGFTELFNHIRMIYARAKAQRTLLEEFKEHVIKQSSSSEQLISEIIEPYADAYLIARKNEYVSTANASDVNSLLKWLNRIDNSDWMPCAILFLSIHKDSPEYVLWFFQKLERLAAYMHISAKNVNQRIARYALVLEELISTHSLDNPVKAVELTEAEKLEMQDVLNSDIYYLTARRRNYLILRLDSFLSDGAATYDAKVLTIEHVLPQTVEAGSAWEENWPEEEVRKQWVHKISNLVPLTQQRNSSASNFDFDKKKTAYFGGRKGVSSYVTTTQVLNTPEWTLNVVKERQVNLLEVLKDGWDLKTEPST